jgi:hypothetical protein
MLVRYRLFNGDWKIKNMTPKRWQQIDELFHATLAYEPSQRTEFLNPIRFENKFLAQVFNLNGLSLLQDQTTRE